MSISSHTARSATLLWSVPGTLPGVASLVCGIAAQGFAGVVVEGGDPALESISRAAPRLRLLRTCTRSAASRWRRLTRFPDPNAPDQAGPVVAAHLATLPPGTECAVALDIVLRPTTAQAWRAAEMLPPATMATALVGTAPEILTRMAAYMALGISLFVLTAPPARADYAAVAAELLPLCRNVPPARPLDFSARQVHEKAL
jgi:hypothetical protein